MQLSFNLRHAFLLLLFRSADIWQSACCFRKPFSLATVATEADPPSAETQRGHGPSLPGELGSLLPGRRAPSPGRQLRVRPAQSFPSNLAATQSPPRAVTTIFITGNDMENGRKILRKIKVNSVNLMPEFSLTGGRGGFICSHLLSCKPGQRVGAGVDRGLLQHSLLPPKISAGGSLNLHMKKFYMSKFSQHL